MIISASRRCDIPAFFSEWFLVRIKEGFVLVRNPINPKAVSRISLSPDVVDGIVFWTKDPAPMIGKLDELKDYPYYFQYTMTPYGRDVEENLPPKRDIIETFKKLADKIGANRVIWRYDPILVNDKYSFDYHTETFFTMAKELSGYSKKCVISFVDYYKSILTNIKELELHTITENDIRNIAKNFSKTAGEWGFTIDTCAEAVDLSEYGIGHAKCVDDAIFKEITGYRYDVEKDSNQRPECGCVASIDIGAYNTCLHGCRYCYANHSNKLVERNFAQYDKSSCILCGKVNDTDVVKDREARSLKKAQLEFDV